jgi:hypothetical protein
MMIRMANKTMLMAMAIMVMMTTLSILYNFKRAKVIKKKHMCKRVSFCTYFYLRFSHALARMRKRLVMSAVLGVYLRFKAFVDKLRHISKIIKK